MKSNRHSHFHSMLRQYHRAITQQALAPYFTPTPLREVIAANLAQDTVVNQLGATPYFHFDNNLIAEGNAYVESQHILIVQLASEHGSGRVQRRAFGRLCHAVQDFYAHTNYVTLWLSRHGGIIGNAPNKINALDRQVLQHQELASGTFILWRDLFYFIPGIGALLKKLYLPADSHEAMHLDSPQRNPYFDYAFQAAIQRTQYEYTRLVTALRRRAGEEAIQRFCGKM